MRILVCGGRDYDYAKSNVLYAALDLVTLAETDIFIITGGARGVDHLAACWALSHDYGQKVYPADWKTFGKKAGYLRNMQMLKEGKPDLVVAFPGGKGTAMMVDLATKAGVKVIQMGTLGAGSQHTEIRDNAAIFRTERFSQIYLQRIFELSPTESSFRRISILREVMDQERKWLENMGQEYEEIMLAQETAQELAQDIIDKLEP